MNKSLNKYIVDQYKKFYTFKIVDLKNKRKISKSSYISKNLNHILFIHN